MARARNIKPSFFTNDRLAEVHPLGRLLFAGLWTLADREGRLEDRPKRIKAEILPYDTANVDRLLDDLQRHCFILRYVVDEHRFIQILAFAKHQNPHVKEGPSTIPAPDEHGASTVQEPEIPERTGLIPDSGFLIPDSPIPHPDSGSRIADPLRESPRSPQAAHGTRLSTDWALPNEWADWTRNECQDWDERRIQTTAAKFADYWHAVAGSKGRKADWFGTWRNWVRREVENGPRRNGTTSKLSEAGRATAEAGQRWIEEQERKEKRNAAS